MARLTAPKEESTRAVKAFEEYLALGPRRSLRKLAEGQGPSGTTYRLPTIENWSSTFCWRDRAADYDKKVTHAAVALTDDDTTLGHEEARAARLLVARAARHLALAILKAKEQDPESIRRASLIGAVQLLQHADTTERLDMGEATSRSEIIKSQPALRIIREDARPKPVIEQAPEVSPDDAVDAEE